MAPTVRKNSSSNNHHSHAKQQNFSSRKAARGGIVFPTHPLGYAPAGFYTLESHSMSGSPPRNSPVSWKAGGRMIPRRQTAGSSSDDSGSGSPTRSPVPALVNKPAWDMDTLKSQVGFLGLEKPHSLGGGSIFLFWCLQEGDVLW